MKFGISSQSFKKIWKFRVKTPDPVIVAKDLVPHTDTETEPHAQFWSKQVEAFIQRRARDTEVDTRLVQPGGKQRLTSHMFSIPSPEPPRHTPSPPPALGLSRSAVRERDQTRGTSALRGRRRACDLWVGCEGNAVVSEIKVMGSKMRPSWASGLRWRLWWHWLSCDWDF